MKLYKVKEVAGIFRVAERTVYNWVEFGYIRAVKVGSEDGKGTIRITEDALQEFIEKYTTIESPVLFHRKR
ncbi:helix-turn-helix domain-containing protein [Thermodesulfovibrio thiophilus]|uniref:helix-turn-helix domain-containing protein n=1 Tax=Thermodesulfovibrio thiophilus TaxID=340095 RepID=UPI000415D5BB|nr:helix-turn-helix domain-containing protein [Thermodesulfovibrio thiophilus]